MTVTDLEASTGHRLAALPNFLKHTAQHRSEGFSSPVTNLSLTDLPVSPKETECPPELSHG